MYGFFLLKLIRTTMKNHGQTVSFFHLFDNIYVYINLYVVHLQLFYYTLGFRSQHYWSFPIKDNPTVCFVTLLCGNTSIICRYNPFIFKLFRLTSWCNLQLFINIRFFMEAWNLYKQCSEESRRLREKQRRNKVKPTASALADTSESSQAASNEWVITKHDFAEPTSGGLVATFTEFLYCKSVCVA